MAVRVHTRFHTAGQRSPKTLASVVALLAWKLAVEGVRRMRTADYDIDIGRPFFDIVCEFMVFLAVAADRVAYRELDGEMRVAFTTALVTRLAEMVEENRYLLMDEELPGGLRQHFLDLFNRRGADYAGFDYGATGPDFGFRRYFAACLREALPEKDKLWVVDQAMDIEAPEALKALEKALAGLFHPETNESRRRRDGGATGD
jgi:hypothetical protein